MFFLLRFWVKYTSYIVILDCISILFYYIVLEYNYNLNIDFLNMLLMLEQGRYTWRHDSTLNKIREFVNQVNDSGNVDLGENPWTIPPDLLVTSDRPDLVSQYLNLLSPLKIM